MTVIFHTPQNTLWNELAEEFRVSTGADVVRIDRDAPLSELDADVRERAVALVAFAASGEVLDSLPSLRLVAIPMAGINTLAIGPARERGLQVVNAHANGMWVAERAMALTLGFRGQLVRGDRDLRRGRWHGFAAAEPPTQSWESLYDTTVAILGTGSIGQWTARFLNPFGVRCRGFRRRPGTDGLPEGLFESVTTDLSEALNGASTVVSTLPLTETTRGLVDAAALEQMRGAVLVNVGRGEVIDEQALYEALHAGTLAGAALDTWYRYPNPPGSEQLPSEYPFHELDNVLLSPHLGGYTAAATRASAREVVDAVARWLADGAPADRGGTVDVEQGY